jgi:hypothetical protein
MPRPSHTTFPSRNNSPAEAAARSLVPKLIARTSASKAAGPAVAVDREVVVASAVRLSRCWLQPAPGSARTPSRATHLVSHRTTTRTLFRPSDSLCPKASASSASLQCCTTHPIGRVCLAGRYPLGLRWISTPAALVFRRLLRPAEPWDGWR